MLLLEVPAPIESTSVSHITELFGQTRSRVGLRHALIAPDGHVPSVVPGISGGVVNILISERLGAGFVQLLVTFEEGGSAHFAAGEIETFGYIMNGAVELDIDGEVHRLSRGQYFFAAAWHAASLGRAEAGTRLTVFQKRFQRLPEVELPAPVIGDESKVEALPFLGNEHARLKSLLPDTAAFDMAVNLFTYQPGATLPFVETHVMEHGLIMLEGQGVYRLEESWYPVAKGDVIWMAPYCPQWFVAMGETPASYLYYKDVNRPAL